MPSYISFLHPNLYSQFLLCEYGVICAIIIFKFSSVVGLREYYSQTDERPVAPRIPVMVNMTSVSSSSKRSKKLQSSSAHHRSPSLDQIHAANRNAALLDEYSDEDEDLQADQEVRMILMFL